MAQYIWLVYLFFCGFAGWAGLFIDDPVSGYLMAITVGAYTLLAYLDIKRQWDTL